MEAIQINNYTFSKPLVSDNSGFSKWGIGTKGGKPYFVKEFLSPVFPSDDSVFTEQKKLDRIRLCQNFVDDKMSLYCALRSLSDGHIVTVEQFFRVSSKFYISTRAVTEPLVSMEEIAKSSFLERLRLCCAIAHSMARVHAQGIVHSDIKPDNILVVRRGCLRPNIIDFDCSFFGHNCPKPDDELNGDLVYLSPEGFLHIAGIESNLTCKMDVFALGLLFCQYLTGKLPRFDTEEYQYAYESVLDDNPLGLEGVLNNVCRDLLQRMLSKAPADRPDMESVFQTLNTLLLAGLKRTPPERTAPETAAIPIPEPEPGPVPDPVPEPEPQPDPVDAFFQRAGDL